MQELLLLPAAGPRPSAVFRRYLDISSRFVFGLKETLVTRLMYKHPTRSYKGAPHDSYSLTDPNVRAPTLGVEESQAGPFHLDCSELK